MAPSTEPLAEIRHLSVTFESPTGRVRAVDDISFAVGAGRRVGLVGESGSGKSLTGMSMLGLVDAPGVVSEGELVFDGTAYEFGSPGLRALRGREISMIFQEPMTALDPVATIGAQMREVIRRHTGLGRSAAKELAIETLASVGIPDPARRYDEYTFQLSGGMRQRAMIAIAISCHPKLLVADEPTTALDVTTQAQILDLLRRISVENGMSVLLISHDLGVVAELCERLICVYAGQVVEEAGIDTALLQPRHPYLSGLLRSMPRNEARGTRLASIPGVVPSPGAMPEGCRFGPRCAHHTAVCDEPQILRSAAAGVSVRCGRSAELELTGVIHEEGSR